jgi:hypothetical protein
VARCHVEEAPLSSRGCGPNRVDGGARPVFRVRADDSGNDNADDNRPPPAHREVGSRRRSKAGEQVACFWGSAGAVHVVRVRKTGYVDKAGRVRDYESAYLRRTYREVLDVAKHGVPPGCPPGPGSAMGWPVMYRARGSCLTTTGANGTLYVIKTDFPTGIYVI